MNSRPLAVTFPSRYPNSMQSLMTALILAALWNANPAIAATASKKAAKSNQPKTLMTIAEYVLANGVDKDIKGPTARTLGYNVDVLPTKALRQKSDVAFDKQEHSFHVILNANSKSKNRIDALLLSRALATEQNGRKHVDLLDAKVSTSGELLILMHVVGFAGDVKRTSLDINSKEAKALFNTELDYQLTRIDFNSLKK
jgi:hypothetical protein